MKTNSILTVFTIVVVVLFSNCNNSEKNNSKKKPSTQEIKVKKTPPCQKYLLKNKENNLNISILLDLSDRIDSKKYLNKTMSYADRDLGYINTITQSFVKHIKQKKIILMHDKMQVFFEPPPANPSINDILQKLKVFLDKNLKKADIENTLTNYKELPKKVYNLAIKDSKFIGSDTWRFFKDKVKNYCIENCNRNILIILTDGYMYHINSKIKKGNKTTYITPKMLRNLGLNKSNWKKIMDKNGYGFIPETKNLDSLEVLVLGIENHDKIRNPYGKDVLKEYWTKWLTSMGVKRFELHGADLPSNMEGIIERFINNNNQ